MLWGLRAVIPLTLQLEGIQMCLVTDLGPQGKDRKQNPEAKQSRREGSQTLTSQTTLRYSSDPSPEVAPVFLQLLIYSLFSWNSTNQPRSRISVWFSQRVCACGDVLICSPRGPWRGLQSADRSRWYGHATVSQKKTNFLPAKMATSAGWLHGREREQRGLPCELPRWRQCVVLSCWLSVWKTNTRRLYLLTHSEAVMNHSKTSHLTFCRGLLFISQMFSLQGADRAELGQERNEGET